MGQAWQSLSDGKEEAEDIQSDVGGTGRLQELGM